MDHSQPPKVSVDEMNAFIGGHFGGASNACEHMAFGSGRKCKAMHMTARQIHQKWCRAVLRFAVDAEPHIAREDQEDLMQMHMAMRGDAPVKPGGAVNDRLDMQKVRKRALLAVKLPGGDGLACL